MVEANPVKFYIARYFLLVMAFIQWSLGILLLYFEGFTMGTVAISVLFFAFGILLVVLNNVVSDKIKRVAVGDEKIVVLEEDHYLRFEWPEVKSLRIVPFLNLCKVKFRGKKGTFYFFLAGNIRSAIERLFNQSKNEKKEFDLQ